MLALGILAVETFIEACPETCAAEHEAAIKVQGERFSIETCVTRPALRARRGPDVKRIRSRFRAAMRTINRYRVVGN